MGIQLPMVAIAVLVVFLFLTIPLRLLIYFSKSYRLAIVSREIADGILLFLTVVAAVNTATIFLYVPYQEGDNIYYKYVLPTSVSYVLIAPYFHILSWLVGRRPFFTKKHLPYLDYFSLYLRSFNEDRKRHFLRIRMAKVMNSWFPLYAIGKPDEFMPPAGAKRMYVDNDWQDIVLGMIQRAKIILHRVNTSENYLWEFEQCHKLGFISKSIFWTDDASEYAAFRQLVSERYGVAFPELGDQKEQAVVYLKADGSWQVIYLDKPPDYQRFERQFEEDHTELFAQNESYLYGKRHKLRQFFTFYRQDAIPAGVQRWSWAAFLAPEFYVICQRLRYRVWIFLLIVHCEVLPMILCTKPLNITILSAIRLFIMVVLGRNGRKAVWLSHQWESVAYFDKSIRYGNIASIALWVTYVLFWITTIFLLHIL